MPVSVRPFDNLRRKPVAHARAVPADPPAQAPALTIDVGAVIVSTLDDVPSVVVVDDRQDRTLPGGPVRPAPWIGLEDDLRRAVEAETGIALGHVEQLCTLARPNDRQAGPNTPSGVCISYLALTRPGALAERAGVHWAGWYDHLPWEDWRKGRPRVLAEFIEPALAEWAAHADVDPGLAGDPVAPGDRVRLAFGTGHAWDEERVADRYDLLHESDLLIEAHGRDPRANMGERPGQVLAGDHRRRLAIAIGRLRATMKYRPVVFELMPPEFTLFELQRVVEAILGTRLHKQNFRRLVEGTGLVEATGDIKLHTGGRPAKQMRFRREVVLERSSAGVRVKAGRA